jgi:hypothetical protein
MGKIEAVKIGKVWRVMPDSALTGKNALRKKTLEILLNVFKTGSRASWRVLGKGSDG